MFDSKRVPNKKNENLILEDRRVYKVLVKERKHIRAYKQEQNFWTLQIWEG